MKTKKRIPFTRIAPIEPDDRTKIFYIRRILLEALITLAVILLLNAVLGRWTQILLSLLALGILAIVASLQWLLAAQVNKGLKKAQLNVQEIIDREAALHSSEEKFRAFVEESSEGFVLTDENGIVIEWNHSMEVITGIERKNALGNTAWELQTLFMLPERRTEQAVETSKQYIQEALQTGSSPLNNQIMEVDICRITGERLTIEQEAFAVKSVKGYWIGSILRDISARKKAEIAQKESLLRLNALLDNIPDAAFIKDINGIFTAVNKPMAEIFAETPDGFIGKSDFDFLPDSYANKIQADDQELIRTQQPQRVEESHIGLDGKEYWVETLKTPIINDQGEVVGIAAIGRDITERKSVEKIQASIYRISEAANTAPSLNELYRNIHSTISDLMPAENFYIALYVPSSDLIFFPYHVDGEEPEVEWPPIKPGKGFTSYVYRTGKPLLVTPELFEQLEQAGEIELMGKKPVDWLGVPLNTQHGKIGVMAVQTYRPTERLHESDKDILMFVSTQVAMVIERRKMEEALRTSQANLEDAQRMVHIGSWDWDYLTGEITFSNELYRIFGVEPGTLPSLDTLFQLTHSEDRARVQAVVEKSLKENQPYTLDHRLIRPDNVELIIHSQSEVFYNEDGQPVRRIGMLQDITQVRQVEAEREKLIGELQSKNTELDRFTYTVSHDLRSPLVTIRGFLGFMEKDIQAGKTESIAKDMTRIIAAANKMQQFLDELLVLSRAGQIINPPESVSFHTIAVDTIEMLRGRIEARRVQVNIADNLPVILCDRTRLIQVVQNLVDNAVKFLGDQPNPRIEIGTEGKDMQGKAVLFVRDNGIGIQPQFHKKVFDLFNKLDSQTEGTGIGLTLVKRIIEAHGGQVWLTSAGEGTGSTFYFSCPTPGDEVKLASVDGTL
jgi:PAS domain S-box-containing protein